MKRLVPILFFLVASLSLYAADGALGTWIARTTKGPCLAGSGWRITYKVAGGDPNLLTTVTTQLDGKDRHTFTVLKLQGKQYGTSTAELSTDGKVLKVVNDITALAGAQKTGKETSYWDKQ